MIVVFDTNIWLAELGLKTTLGAAVRFFLRQQNARIALPEVVRLEVEHNLRNQLKEFVSNISKNHRQLLTAFGTLKEVVLPDDEAIEKKVSELFENTGVEVSEVPFSLESARQSFIKTIDKLPPSDKSQEFKDGVMWSDCFELLKQDDVCLVTADKAFYQGRDYAQGLAKSLREELLPSEHSLKLISSLPDLLEEIQTDIKLSEDALAEAFLEKYKDFIEGILKNNCFELDKRLRVQSTLYATEKTGFLYLEFNMEYECNDISGDDRIDGLLILHGDGMYNSVSSSFEELRNFGEELNYKLSDGTEKQVRSCVLYAGGIVFGHREVSHTVKYKID